MAKIVGQDMSTGFVTLELDDGRTTIAPMDVAYNSFPQLRAPTPDPAAGMGMGAIPTPAQPPMPAMPQAPMPAPAPAEEAAQMSMPAEPVAPPPAPEPAASAVEVPGMVSTAQRGNISINTAKLTPAPAGVDPAGATAALDIVGGQLADAQSEKRTALEAQAGVKMASAKAAEPFARETEQLMLMEQARREQATMDVQKQLAMEESRINEALMAIPQVDPHRFWNSRTGFQRALGVAAAGMAGFLNPGAPKNQVVDAVQQMIQDDLRSQESNVESAKFKVSAAERGYGRLANRLEADELAKRELGLYKLETVKASLAAKMAEFESPLTQAEYAGLIADLDIVSAQQKADYLKLMHDTFMADKNFELDRWYKQEQVKLEKGRLALGWAGERRMSQPKPGDMPKIPEPKGVIGKATGFTTVDGHDFIVPGEDEKARQENTQHFQRVAGGAAEALSALRDLSTQDFGALAKLDPAARQLRIAEMSKAMLGKMSADGQSVARASNFDAEQILSQFGGDLTVMQTMLDSDGHMRKELIAKAYDDIISGANMLANSTGPVMDSDVNKWRQRLGRELTIDEMEKAKLLKPAQYDPPPWAKQLRVSAEPREESLNKLLKTRVGPGTTGSEESATSIPRGEALLKDAKAGRYNGDPGAIMSAAEAMKALSREYKASSNPTVRARADEAARLSVDLAKASVSIARDAEKRATTPTQRVVGGGGRQSVQVTPPAGLSEDQRKLLQDIQGTSTTPYTTGSGKGGSFSSAPPADAYSPPKLRK